jgi:hypothetical protein
LNKSHAQVRDYSLVILRPEKTAIACVNKASFKVRGLDADASLSSRFFLYRTQESVYQEDFYNRLLTLPAVSVTEQVYHWMEGSPLAASVTDIYLAGQADFLITGKVYEMYADIRDRKEPHTVLKIKLIVYDMSCEGKEIRLEKVYYRRTPIEMFSPPLLVNGWSEALRDILVEFESDLDGLIQNP